MSKTELKNSQMNPEMEDNQTVQPQLPSNRYSEALKSKQEEFPEKEQGILLNIEDDLTVSDYVAAIGNIIGSKNITYVSHISNKRICLFLKSLQFVDKIVNEHRIISIKDKEISVRRLVSPATRLIISNVYPYIPHEIVENELRGIGIKTVSPMSCIKASIVGEEYSHIKSFRRQIYIMPTESELPSSIMITFKNTNYRIYLSDDNLRCYICKTPGHIARRCPNLIAREPPHQVSHQTHLPPSAQNTNVNEENPTIVEIPIPVETNIHPSTSEKPNIETPNRKINIQQNVIFTSKEAVKRTAETITTPTDSIADDPISQLSQEEISQIIVGTNKTSRSKKKMRKSNSTENVSSPGGQEPRDSSILKENLKPIIKPLEEKTIVTDLSFEQIVDFFENSQDHKDLLSLAREYTGDIPKLLVLLDDIKLHITSKGTKKRCTRLKNDIYTLLKTEQTNILKQSNLLEQTSLAELSSSSDSESEHNFY